MGIIRLFAILFAIAMLLWLVISLPLLIVSSVKLYWPGILVIGLTDLFIMALIPRNVYRRYLVKSTARIVAICTSVLGLGFVGVSFFFIFLITKPTERLFDNWQAGIVAWGLMLVAFTIVIPLAVYYILRGAGWALEKLMR